MRHSRINSHGRGSDECSKTATGVRILKQAGRWGSALLQVVAQAPAACTGMALLCEILSFSDRWSSVLLISLEVATAASAFLHVQGQRAG